ncbi:MULTISPECIES: hypothetical protein [Prochlorococcus]|uniref:hypothetical protein n=1 Tax=Prochlorococcus TaxID=1218 RepID=UPI001F3A6F18|nr:hypothetical protein [Prochlorococcus marinus]
MRRNLDRSTDAISAASTTQADCWYGITVQKQYKALATAGALYCFNHLTLCLK